MKINLFFVFFNREKQLHYADIVHAYKQGLSRELSRTGSQSDRNSDINSEGVYSPTNKSRPTIRSGSNASDSFKHGNGMHNAVLERSASSGPDTNHRLDSTSSGAQDDILSDNSGSGGDVFSSSGMHYRYKGSIRDTPVTTCDLLCFSFQIARGMEYLSSKKVVYMYFQTFFYICSVLKKTCLLFVTSIL